MNEEDELEEFLVSVRETAVQQPHLCCVCLKRLDDPAQATRYTRPIMGQSAIETRFCDRDTGHQEPCCSNTLAHAIYKEDEKQGKHSSNPVWRNTNFGSGVS